ncbi:MAG TPA: carboxylesterase family protein, partial [Saprospiraceae bacterium]|nr:carboxylesterase family protein [Saprospiraceae bacterium]
FTHKHTIAQLATYGSYHGMELFYVFNNWENTSLGSGILFHTQDDSVQKQMLKYWVNFAKTGNPNGNSLVTWPDYHNSADCYLEIKATPNGSQCGLRTVQTDLWDAVSGFTGCISTTEVGAIKIEDSLVFYPNPAQNSFTVELPAQIGTLNITDIDGRKISTQNNLSGKTEIDCTSFPNGIYVIQLNDGTNITSGKIIILK